MPHAAFSSHHLGVYVYTIYTKSVLHFRREVVLQYAVLPEVPNVIEYALFHSRHLHLIDQNYLSIHNVWHH